MSLLVCDLCAKEYPTSRFPDLDLGVVCDGCLTGQQMSKTDEAIKKKVKDMASQLSTLSEDEVIVGLPKLKNVMSSIYREFGGPADFASHFFWVISELGKRKPVPTALGTLMISFMKLHHSIEQADENISARDMTDDQLRREMDLEMMKLLMESAGDPDKRAMLDRVLSARGLKLEESSPKEVMASVAESSGSEIEKSDFEERLEQIQAFSQGGEA